MILNRIWVGVLVLAAYGVTFCKSVPDQRVSVSRKGTTYLQVISFNTLSATDKGQYKLIIKIGQKDTNACSVPGTSYTIVATLQNTGADTLKYIDWSCSHDIWLSNDTAVSVYQPFGLCNNQCDKNVIAINKVLPHQRKTIVLRVFRKKSARHGITKLQIGIVLQRVLHEKDMERYIDLLMHGQYQLHLQTQNAVWSNTISFPK